MPGAVPTFNKGLKSLNPSGALVPAIIDYLTVTLPRDAVCELFDGDSRIASGLDAMHEATQRDVAQHLVAHLGLGVALNPSRGGFRHFYDFHFKLHTPEGEPCGLLAFGGERQRFSVMIQITGAGCAHVGAWAQTRARLEALRAKITRVDVAHDDYAGVHGVNDAIRWHAEGLFTTAGRPPALQVVGWDDGSGKSVYIGKNTGNQQLVVYEKGREQGARDGDEGVNWVRWEARFGSSYRTVPLDVLTNPVGYLVGHYPPLRHWIEAVCSRMRTARERSASNLAHAVRWAKRQYGSLLGLLHEHLSEPERFARFVTRHVSKRTPPPWLLKNPHGASSIEWAISALECPT